MKYLILLLALAGCTSLPTQNTALNSVVFVETPDGSGSGVVLNDKCIVTADHVIANEQIIMMQNHKGDRFFATKAYENEPSDIAVVCTDKPLKAPPVIFAHDKPEEWEPVFTIGFPMGKKNILTEGRYQGDDVVSLQSAPGNSGGGVFNKDGEYIGFVDSFQVQMTAYGILGFPHITNIVPASKIAELLDKAGINYTKD
jgi:S1-C subfamily serine protease